MINTMDIANEAQDVLDALSGRAEAEAQIWRDLPADFTRDEWGPVVSYMITDLIDGDDPLDEDEWPAMMADSYLPSIAPDITAAEWAIFSEHELWRYESVMDEAAACGAGDNLRALASVAIYHAHYFLARAVFDNLRPYARRDDD